MTTDKDNKVCYASMWHLRHTWCMIQLDLILKKELKRFFRFFRYVFVEIIKQYLNNISSLSLLIFPRKDENKVLNLFMAPMSD